MRAFEEVMKLKMFTKICAFVFAMGMAATYVEAAPAKGASANDAALIDDANGTAGNAAEQKASPENANAESAQNAKESSQQSACEPAAKEESGFPILPVVFSAIGTIAFVVLAIIF